MARYVIMRDERTQPRSRPAVIAIRDGGSLLALAFPLLWLLWHRLWIASLLLIAASLALGFFSSDPQLGGFVLAASIVLAILVGLEAQGWRVAKARRQGYAVVDIIEASDRAEAELRFAERFGLSGRDNRSDGNPGPSEGDVPEFLYEPPQGTSR
ncbi:MULTISPECIES: DUF2628 domain-containing protein [unclassified Roseitalea]|uniref:DUF2628 domain-containing protein n=1 Tax=unclassified Roseitalea TaxID=2639107 RepID=UPI00273D8E12|nr:MULTISPECIES: DUF2628 domain-containing protein [unclassified Roseitalea]